MAGRVRPPNKEGQPRTAGLKVMRAAPGEPVLIHGWLLAGPPGGSLGARVARSGKTQVLGRSRARFFHDSQIRPLWSITFTPGPGQMGQVSGNVRGGRVWRPPGRGPLGLGRHRGVIIDRKGDVKKTLAIFSLLIVLGAGWGPSARAAGENCAQARRLFEQSLAQLQAATQKKLLTRAVTLCPAYAEALNNLALLWEREGRLDRAASYYAKALEARPGFCAPLAGLGDIAYARGRYPQAVGYYLRFLEALPAEKKRGDPQGLSIHEPAYRAKLERSRLKASILQASMTQVVKGQSLVRGLYSPARHRGPGGEMLPERLALWLNFAPGKDHLGARARRQLGQLARALASPRLQGCRILIEGHASPGEVKGQAQGLSLRRAGQVRDLLVARGISPSRLQVAGLGLSRPLARPGQPKGQAVNRRVELVNLGR